MNDSLPSYPELSSIAQLSSPQSLLGRSIHWTEKRDGSNLRIALVDGEVKIATRHQDEASQQFQKYFWATPQAQGVTEMLKAHSGEPESPASDFQFDPVIFGELLNRPLQRTGIVWVR